MATMAAARARGRRVLRRADAVGRLDDEAAIDRPPGPRRDAVGQAVLPLRRRALARRRPGRAAAARRPPTTAATTSGATSTTATSSRCRDTWEYPWYAAWDLAFHCVALAHVDPAFAKDQLLLLCREWYMHPNGQLPAYEWAFGDVNPPVHAWAALRVFEIDGGHGLRLPRAHLPEAAPELHLVGEPQGRRRQQRVRGRLPRPRQHRPDRPLGAAPGRGPARAVRRHGAGWRMYCLNMLEIAARPGRARPDLRGHRAPSSSSTSPTSRRPSTTAACGTRRTASTTTCCRSADERDPAAGPLDGRPAAAVRGHDRSARGRWRALPDVHAPASTGSSSTARSSPRTSTTRTVRAGSGGPAAGRSSARSGSTASSSCAARRGRVPLAARHPLALRPPPRASPSCSTSPACDVTRRLRAGRVDDRPVRRQLELARAGLVPGQLPRHRGAARLRTASSATTSSSSARPARAAAAPRRRWPTSSPTGSSSLFRDDADGRRPVLRPVRQVPAPTRPGTTLLPFHEYFHGDTGAGLGASHQTGWTGLVADLLLRRDP